MYASFFHLQREPFSIAPDPHFLFMSEAHREALAHLLYGLDGGGGFVLLTGEIGAGKTTVCRCFLDQVPATCDVAYIFNPKLGAIELLRTINDEFGITLPAGAASVKDHVDALNAFLLRSHAAGRNSVLVIDEAQSLAPEVLEQLRLLTNLETAERKLLQIVLIGQPELRAMLARPELEQLAQRVIARFHLPALSAAESAQYVRHRLTVAGLAGENPFDARALARLHEIGGGIPRRINLLAARALLGGYALGRSRIDRAIVEQAAREVFDLGPAPARSRRIATAALLGLGLVAASAAALYAWPGGAGHTPVTGGAASALAAATPASLPVARAASAASAAAAAPDAAPPPSVSLVDLLAAAGHDEATGWRRLAQLWGVELGAETTCAAAELSLLRCWRGSGGLMQLRELDRPALLSLRDEHGNPVAALLVGLAAHDAVIEAGGRRQRLALTELASAWRGEFTTFWRLPPGFAQAAGDKAPPELAAWLDSRLPGAPGAAMATRIAAFQLAQGLAPDGRAGPLTLMQLNRASGVAEPRLER